MFWEGMIHSQTEVANEQVLFLVLLEKELSQSV